MAQLSPFDREHRKAQNKKILTYGCLPIDARDTLDILKDEIKEYWDFLIPGGKLMIHVN